MATVEHFRRLFAYDDWANREVVAALREAGSPPARPLKLMAHLLSAERLWLERLRRQTQTFPVWPVFSLQQCEVQAAEMLSLWNQYLDEVHEGSATITYRNTKGETWTNRIEDVLTHVIMHSAYHRGQIAASMRDSGVEPPYTDFIHSIRQGLVE
jgi:uncharacterized damage-inducible protein DinB